MLLTESLLCEMAVKQELSLVVRKPAFCICENKDADQLRGNCEADQRLCFRYALVICNHGPPTPGAGRGIAVEMSGVFTFALSPQCGGNTRDLCYIGKKGGAMKT